MASEPSHNDLIRLVPAALLAGLAGTIAITLSQKVEQSLTGREDSRTPAQGVERATGIDPGSDAAEERLSNATHWSYGTLVGAGWLLALRRLDEPARSLALFGGVWGLALALESFANPDEPVTQWSAQGIATDLGHHLVYAAATGAAFAGLERALAPAD